MAKNKKETSEPLLLAGIREIEKNGLQNLSTRKIAAQCGISDGLRSA